MKNEKIVLQQRPDGIIQEDDFSFEQEELRQIEDGEILIKIAFISCDPAIRGWMNEGTTYIKGIELGAVIRAFAAGEVVESKKNNYPVGCYVTGLLGTQSYAISKGDGLTKIEELDDPLSYYLGVLGMPGMTAYFGLLEKGKPLEGETVFISGAAGVVGSTVGQIAKIKGCKVVGTAGSQTKCNYLTKECGFDYAINYKTEDVDQKLKEYCPKGVHLFYDNVGGPLLDIVLKNLAKGARVVICGAISQYNKKEIYGPKNYMKIVTARGIITGIIVFDFIDQYPQAASEMSGWIKDAKLHAKEHIVEGLKQFPSSLKMLFTGENFGKLLIKL